MFSNKAETNSINIYGEIFNIDRWLDMWAVSRDLDGKVLFNQKEKNNIKTDTYPM